MLKLSGSRARCAVLTLAMLGATPAPAQDGWPGDAHMTLEPIAAPVGVLDDSGVAWISAKLAMRTVSEAVELWADAEIELDDVALAAERALARRWLNDDCGDELTTREVAIAPTPAETAVRVSFDIVYKRNQCAIGSSALVEAKGRATVDLWVEVEEARPVLRGKVLEEGFAPKVDVLGVLKIEGLDEEGTRDVILQLLQDLLDREMKKANTKIREAIEAAPTAIVIEQAAIGANADGMIILKTEARARATAEDADLLINAAVSRGFD